MRRPNLRQVEAFRALILTGSTTGSLTAAAVPMPIVGTRFAGGRVSMPVPAGTHVESEFACEVVETVSHGIAPKK